MSATTAAPPAQDSSKKSDNAMFLAQQGQNNGGANGAFSIDDLKEALGGMGGVSPELMELLGNFASNGKFVADLPPHKHLENLYKDAEKSAGGDSAKMLEKLEEGIKELKENGTIEFGEDTLLAAVKRVAKEIPSGENAAENFSAEVISSVGKDGAKVVFASGPRHLEGTIHLSSAAQYLKEGQDVYGYNQEVTVTDDQLKEFVGDEPTVTRYGMDPAGHMYEIGEQPLSAAMETIGPNATMTLMTHEGDGDGPENTGFVKIEGDDGVTYSNLGSFSEMDSEMSAALGQAPQGPDASKPELDQKLAMTNAPGVSPSLDMNGPTVLS